MQRTAGSHMVRMSISGEWLTERAREVMLSEEPVRAYRILAEGLDGDGAEAAAKGILDGTKKLVGDSGDDSIELVDDDPNDPSTAKYIADLRFIYAGRMRHNKRWWRPRAVVTSFCADDMRDVPRCRPSYAPTLRAVRAARVAYYAGGDERVFEILTDPSARCLNKLERAPDGEYRMQTGGLCGNAWCVRCALRGFEHVIFEPCGDLPHWWPAPADPKAALQDFLAHGRRLEDDGCAQRHLHTPNVDEEDAEAMKREREERRREADEAQAKREAEWDASVVTMRKAIQEQAGADTFPMDLGDGRVLTVPRAPFECWALGRSKKLRHLRPHWEVRSPSGMKLPLDDPYHTDWTIGAGLDPNDAYDRRVSEVSTHLMFELQEKLGRFEAGVIVDAGPVTGTVGKDVLVLPNLDPAHLPTMLKARGIITERGGKAAHLAQVAMERGLTIMLVSDAVARYPAGLRVELDPGDGRIHTIGREEDE